MFDLESGYFLTASPLLVSDVQVAGGVVCRKIILLLAAVCVMVILLETEIAELCCRPTSEQTKSTGIAVVQETPAVFQDGVVVEKEVRRTTTANIRQGRMHLGVGDVISIDVRFVDDKTDVPKYCSRSCLMYVCFIEGLTIGALGVLARAMS